MEKPFAKKDIEEAVANSLEPFSKAVASDFKTVHGRLDKIDGRLDKVDYELSEVKSDVRWMKDNSSELFTKLDEFISMYKKQEQGLLMFGA